MAGRGFLIIFFTHHTSSLTHPLQSPSPQRFGFLVFRAGSLTQDQVARVLADRIGDFAAMGFDEFLHAFAAEGGKGAGDNEGQTGKRKVGIADC